jgi:prepilin-type N-terminal cleavage/methylation domain-containing protein
MLFAKMYTVMKQGGFTIVELVVVIAVIGLSLASLLQVMFASDVTRQTIDESAQAQIQSLARLEEIQKMDFDSIQNYVWSNSTFTVNYLPNGLGTIWIDSANPNLYSITATITWTGAGNVQKSYTSKVMVTR